MKRALAFIALFVSGVALVIWGLLAPSHVRAIDAKVLERMEPGNRSLIEAGLALVDLEQIGPARMLLDVAHREGVPGKDEFEAAVETFAQAHPELLPWGGSDPYLEQIFSYSQTGRRLLHRPIIQHLLRVGARAPVLEFLQNSRRPAVQEILQNRKLTRTTHFPPVSSASGQPLEAAIVLTGLLVQGDHLTASLGEWIGEQAAEANRGGDGRAIERFYMDLVSLGMRFDWLQLTAFLDQVQEAETLRNLTFLMRRSEEQIPVIFTAVHLSREPRRVADFLMTFAETGMEDLSYSLRWGQTGLLELLDRQQRVWYPTVRETVITRDPFYSAYQPLLRVAAVSPAVALTLKYLLLALGGFLVARSIRYLRPAPSAIERPLQVRGFDTRRQALFAFCFVLFMLVFAEPFLAQESQKIEYPVRWQFPVAVQPLLGEITQPVDPMINQMTLLAVTVFFAIQIVLYVLCLIKLAEIRRQDINSGLKLRLLDNEENLFDAGLYVGLAGTVVSLVFLALGVIQPSLMAAYSSTLFGIVFVAVFKIGHLRPLRRRLILQSQSLIS